MKIKIPVIDGLLGLAQTWLEGKQEKRRAKDKAEANLIEQSGSWEELQARASADSWKDEFWTVVLSIPLILAFVPWAVPYVNAGFAALETVPDYYKGFVAISISASFGIRNLPKLWGK